MKYLVSLFLQFLFFPIQLFILNPSLFFLRLLKIVIFQKTFSNLFVYYPFFHSYFDTYIKKMVLVHKDTKVLQNNVSEINPFLKDIYNFHNLPFYLTKYYNLKKKIFTASIPSSNKRDALNYLKEVNWDSSNTVNLKEILIKTDSLYNTNLYTMISKGQFPSFIRTNVSLWECIATAALEQFFFRNSRRKNINTRCSRTWNN